MAQIFLPKQIQFTDANGQTQPLGPGFVEVDEATATHWFVQANATDVPPAAAAPAAAVDASPTDDTGSDAAPAKKAKGA